MKTTVLVFFFSLPMILSAQISLNEWSTIKPVTDSSHHNRNACLYGQFSNNFLFWDQELNSTTTQLCFREISNVGLGAEQVALHQTAVKFTNPKIHDLSPYPGQRNFVVMYQTNEGNDIDLKAITYQTDGTFTAPVNIASLTGDDINLTTNDIGTVAWENNGKIWVSHYFMQTNTFTNPYAIDSAGANSPAFSASGLTYLKANGDSTFMISVNLVFNANDWVINNVKYKSIAGKGSALTTAGSFWGGSICLQNKVGSSPSGLILGDYWFYDMEYINSPVYNYSQPAVSDFIMIVKSGMRFLVYVSDSLTEGEIFAETPFYFNGPYNLSQWPGEDRNPKMFVTFPEINVLAVNVFWESDREGFSTIYHSHFDYLFGGVKENSKSEIFLAVPCPFDMETTISFESAQSTPVNIFDLQGRKIKTLPTQKSSNSWQKAVWDGTNQNGSNAPSGSYVAVIKSGTDTKSLLLIKK